MQRITWYALLAVVALVAPIAGRAQAPKTLPPQPKIREIATISGVAATEAVRLPNGRVIVYATRQGNQAHAADDSIFAYDLASKRSTLVTRGFSGELAMSRQGDRLAFDHDVEGSKIEAIWSIPINPATGAATGPAQRVSLGSGGTPSFSPDGKLIAFVPYAGVTDEVAVAPATGGPQRTLAKPDGGGISFTSWSDDGTWVFFTNNQNQGSQLVQRVPAGGGPGETLFALAGGAGAKGLIDGQILFYYPERAARVEGRLAYRTAAGASGEIRVPSFVWERGKKFATPLSLWAKSTNPSDGPPTSTIYELDMTPVLQSVVKR
jgi:dipeptidyl aminopeptidase/acylaminoacyl peptidase